MADVALRLTMLFAPCNAIIADNVSTISVAEEESGG
jgi:hypothetical protein